MKLSLDHLTLVCESSVLKFFSKGLGPFDGSGYRAVNNKILNLFSTKVSFVILGLVYLIVFGIIFDTAFARVDDALAMYTLQAGHFVPFMSFGYSKLINYFYSLLPNLPWYGLSLSVVHIFCVPILLSMVRRAKLLEPFFTLFLVAFFIFYSVFFVFNTTSKR